MNTQNQNLLELLFGVDDFDYTTANVKDFIVKPMSMRFINSIMLDYIK